VIVAIGSIWIEMSAIPKNAPMRIDIVLTIFRWLFPCKGVDARDQISPHSSRGSSVEKNLPKPTGTPQNPGIGLVRAGFCSRSGFRVRSEEPDFICNARDLEVVACKVDIG
jgi:hypothetical protein